MIRKTTMALIALLLAGCGGGSASDGRAAAIQTALDTTKKQTVSVKYGYVCWSSRDFFTKPPPSDYSSIPGVHVGPLVHRLAYQHSDYSLSCKRVTWEPNILLGATTNDNGIGYPQSSAYVSLGRYVVDKVGDEVDGPLGMHVTPFRAHFDASVVGAALIARKEAQQPLDIADGQAIMHKDADGKWIANL